MSSKEKEAPPPPVGYSRHVYFVALVVLLAMCALGTWLMLLTMASGITERQEKLEYLVTQVAWNIYHDLQSLKEKPGPWGPITSRGPVGLPGDVATDDDVPERQDNVR